MSSTLRDGKWICDKCNREPFSPKMDPNSEAGFVTPEWRKANPISNFCQASRWMFVDGPIAVMNIDCDGNDVTPRIVTH